MDKRLEAQGKPSERAREWLKNSAYLIPDGVEVDSLTKLLIGERVDEAEAIRKELEWAATPKLKSGASSRSANTLAWLDNRIAELRAAQQKAPGEGT